MATVEVDMNVCIHSGMCTTIASSVFEMGDAARLHLRKAVVENGAELDSVRDAVACCPVEAISVIG